MDATGYIHSFETLGALDGPGLRMVVFLQGCPLRCRYCHNPDTWMTGPASGQVFTVSEVVHRAERMKPYFGLTGGVTLSGGEPLVQEDFTLTLLTTLHQVGIATAMDTSGWSTLPPERLEAILPQVDLVLLDIKHPDPGRFRWLTGQPIGPLLDFLTLCAKLGKDLWLRQVIVPGWNDNLDQLAQLVRLIQNFKGLRIHRWQLLPYHTLGLPKYEQMGLTYPLEGVPALQSGLLSDLQASLEQLAREAGLMIPI